MNFSTRTSTRFGVLGASALLALGLSACGSSDQAGSSASSTAKASASASLKATASASASTQASSQAQTSTTPGVTEAGASSSAAASSQADSAASSDAASDASAAPSSQAAEATAAAESATASEGSASASAQASQEADPGVGDPNTDGAGSEEPEGETFEELLPEGTDTSDENAAALALAQQFIKDSPFSESGLRTVLIGSYAPESAADYAIANLNVDWNEQAKKAAQAYVDSLSFSEKALTEMLQEAQIGYTAEQVQYAMSNIKADWNQEALQAAESYSAIESMSADEIRAQLIDGEGFTAEQADYAMSHL